MALAKTVLPVLTYTPINYQLTISLRCSLEVDVVECTTVDASDFLKADIAIVATYAYGDGNYQVR